MITTQEFTYPSSDGSHSVHAIQWLPTQATCGVVQIVHGISEYIGRYDPFARYLVERGFTVVGNDHLGHGSTARGPEEYGFLAQHEGWDCLTQDVHTLRERTGERYPGVPYFLLGHSMGSFVARTYLIRYPGTLTGALLSGTGQEAPATVAFAKVLAGLVAHIRGGNARSSLITSLSLGAYNKQFKPNRTDSDWISRDPAIVDTYVADPQCQFVPSVGMFRDMMGGLQFISNPEHLKRMDPDTPVYLFSGDRDPVGANGAGVKKVLDFFREAGVKEVTLKLYPGGRHEMHNEINRSEVFEDVLTWLQAHC